MAIGNPLLAGWDTDSNLRAFEYSGGVFVSIGVLGGIAHVPTSANLTAGAPDAPALAWDHDDNVLIVSHVSVTGTRRVAAYSPALSLISNANVLSGNSGFSDGGSAYNRVKHRQNTRGMASLSSFPSATVSAAGAVGAASNNAAPSGSLAAGIEHTADGVYALVALAISATAGTSMTVIQQVDDTPTWAAGAAPSLTIRPNLIRACPNNRGVAFFDKVSKLAKIYTFIAGAWAYVHDLLLPIGDIMDAAFSPDSRWLAVGVNNGGTYTTRVFKRKGDYFVHTEDIAAMGRLLSFSGDSALLVDANRKKAWEVNDAGFVDVSATAMVNIPNNITAQAMSQGRAEPIGDAYVYDAAITEAAEGTIDWANLKLTLLTSDAVFDQTDTTLSEVTNAGAWEVATGDWPAGGVAMTGVTGAVSSAGIYDFTADEIRHLVMTSAIFARYAVIYDTVSGVPLVNIDLVSERNIATGREAVFSFAAGTFFRYQN